jgi:hypothetical protein
LSICSTLISFEGFLNSYQLEMIFFCFGWTGVWTQGFVLAKQALYYLSHTSSSLPIRSTCFSFELVWLLFLLFYGSLSSLFFSKFQEDRNFFGSFIVLCTVGPQ